jgi:hypothetical protein
MGGLERRRERGERNSIGKAHRIEFTKDSLRSWDLLRSWDSALRAS